MRPYQKGTANRIPEQKQPGALRGLYDSEAERPYKAHPPAKHQGASAGDQLPLTTALLGEQMQNIQECSLVRETSANLRALRR